MSYSEAIEAAGAEVLAIEHFGSYQGDLIAKVSFKDQTGFIVIAYGSCSGCDAFEHFESSFGWDRQPTEQELADFGIGYLDNIESADTLIARFKQDRDWDSDAQYMIEWIEENR